MINKNMSIMELLQTYPELAQALSNMGMGCSRCLGSMTETLEQGIKAHGLDVNEVLEKLENHLKNHG